MLEVIDDGVGFEVDKIYKKSFGLNNIVNRVNVLNGKLDIKSIKNTETKFSIEIPIKD